MTAEPLAADFVSGGYVLVQPYVPAPDRPPGFMPSGLVGSPVITLAQCMAEILPDEWAFGTWLPLPTRPQREAGAAEWGIPASRIDELVTWSAESIREGHVLHHDAFADVESARKFAARFLSHRHEVRLIGLGLHRNLVDDYLRDVEIHAEITPGFPGGPNGVRDGVARGVALAVGGSGLGYEVLDVKLGESNHSWHCYHTEQQIADACGAVSGAHGLIQDYEDALRVATWCSANVKCPPNVWRAWRVEEYDLEGR